MGNIVVSENVSLDGVVQDPVGTEGFRHAGWFDRLASSDRAAWAKVEYDEALGSDALLMGRRTYEWFLARGWATRTGGWADRLRELPKYVVSSTLRPTGWSNSAVLNLDDVAKLKDRFAGDIVVYGSGRLVRTLLAHDMVDELRLMICPLVLGAGERVFGTRPMPLRLAATQPVGDDLILLTYQRV